MIKNLAPESGELPDGWSYVPLAELACIKYGKAKPKNLGNVPVVGSGGVYGFTTSALVDFPTIVIGRKGTAGMAWLIEEPCWPSDTTFYLNWTSQQLETRFIFHCLQHRPLSGEHAKTTLPSLQKADLEKYMVPFPPLPEQHAIAHILRTVQQAREATEKVIDATKQLKQSLMRHLFTYGPVPFDRADQVELKETQIGMMPRHWQDKLLVDIATLQRGKDLPVKERQVGLYPVIGSNGVVGFHSEYVVNGPGVTVGRSGSVGQVTWIDSAHWPLNTTLWVKDFHGNFPKFVYFLLHRVDFAKYAAGVSVPTLNRNLVHPLTIAVPELIEQRKIADALSEVDRKILIEESKLQAFGALFKSLLHYMMTGKVRVNNLAISKIAGVV